jgi:hypothetical protein
VYGIVCVTVETQDPCSFSLLNIRRYQDVGYTGEASQSLMPEPCPVLRGPVRASEACSYQHQTGVLAWESKYAREMCMSVGRVVWGAGSWGWPKLGASDYLGRLHLIRLINFPAAPSGSPIRAFAHTSPRLANNEPTLLPWGTVKIFCLRHDRAGIDGVLLLQIALLEPHFYLITSNQIRR